MDERMTRVPPFAALALFVVAGIVQGRQSAVVAMLAAAAVLGAAAAVVWLGPRRQALVALLAVAAAGLFVLCHGTPSNVGWFGICVVAGWAAFELPVRAAVASTAVLVIAFGVEWLGEPGEPGWAAWTAGTVFTTVACTVTRRQRELMQQLQEAQAALTDQARSEERQRIAAEMHDVIGHALTVSLLHVSSARLALEDDPELARSSLEEAERLAASSLQEVRAAVGLLRRPEGEVDPLPSGTDLGELVATYRRAGRPVELDVHGDLASLGATRGLAVFRIVQESLTNAVRHGQGAPVRVRVDVDDAAATVRIDNAATAGAAAPPGSGVVGMRERAEALGGSLSAGPSAAGWSVEGRLPL